MPRTISLLLSVCFTAALSGCITAYEPVTGAPPGVPMRVRPAVAPPTPPEVTPAPPRPVALVTAPARPAVTPDTPAGRQLRWLIRALSTGEVTNIEERGSSAFLAQVPPGQLRRIVHEWRRDELGLGAVDLVEVEEGPTPDSLIAFVRGITGRYTQIRLAVDGDGRISGLLLAPAIGFQPGVLETWGRLDDQLEALPGRAAFAAYEVVRGEEGASLRQVHVHNAEEQFNIGSTFKLHVLGALGEAILAGEAAWDDEILIDDELKSLPTGQMQLELEGTFFPAERYAELMISISDNTATDHLIEYLGREAVEAYMGRVHAQPSMNRPYLTTMEFFRLKLGMDRINVAQRWIAADEEERRAMLAPGGAVAEATPSLAAAAFWRAPFHIEQIGWFASAEDLVRVMADLHRLEQVEGLEPVGRILRLNPGLAFDPRTWQRIAYKGGSEPGVLSMTWLLEREDERRFIMTVSWNDPARPVELRRLADIAGAAAGLLAQEGLH